MTSVVDWTTDSPLPTREHGRSCRSKSVAGSRVGTCPHEVRGLGSKEGQEVIVAEFGLELNHPTGSSGSHTFL